MCVFDYCRAVGRTMTDALANTIKKRIRKEFDDNYKPKLDEDQKRILEYQLSSPSTSTLEYMANLSETSFNHELDRGVRVESRLFGVLQIAALAVTVVVAAVTIIADGIHTVAMMLNLFVLAIIMLKVMLQTFLVFIPYPESRIGISDVLTNFNSLASRYQGSIRSRLEFATKEFWINEYKNTQFMKCLFNLLWLLLFSGVFVAEILWFAPPAPIPAPGQPFFRRSTFNLPSFIMFRRYLFMEENKSKMPNVRTPSNKSTAVVPKKEPTAVISEREPKAVTPDKKPKIFGIELGEQILLWTGIVSLLISCVIDRFMLKVAFYRLSE
ncbi:MAG: hypothetical protein K2W82_01070 [Candidatus Obscuribacterales bacterium]|nr:hypothetical protein [Candidatus Obscuribacterales bacterium]